MADVPEPTWAWSDYRLPRAVYPTERNIYSENLKIAGPTYMGSWGTLPSWVTNQPSVLLLTHVNVVSLRQEDGHALWDGGYGLCNENAKNGALQTFIDNQKYKFTN